MSAIAIRAEGLAKRYSLGTSPEAYGTLRDTLAEAVGRVLRPSRVAVARPARDLWALRDVSLDVERGTVLGIIGRNGAGKSTLLKLVSRVTAPTRGRLVVDGRVGSLLEVGAGFHPELTGRENIFLNGAVLGMTRAEIRARYDEIVEFAEVGDFLETPVKRYSNGMYLRLAFSIAAHLETEILAVDEVLAVGDTEFQKRCLGKIRSVAQGTGRTVLFVSHNLQAVRSLCDRGVVLLGGRVEFDGPVEDAVTQYLGMVSSSENPQLDTIADRSGDGSVRITSITTRDGSGAERHEVVAGEPLVFELEYERPRPVTGVSLGFTIYNQVGIACTHLATGAVDYSLRGLGHRGVVRCRVDRSPFPVGDYTISVVVTTDDGVADLIPGAAGFRVVASRFFPNAKVSEPDLIHCPVLVDHRWAHDVR
jgi:homopolymeric O-antigen transport system ATP-binding protein